jgi:hypothetical protein
MLRFLLIALAKGMKEKPMRIAMLMIMWAALAAAEEARVQVYTDATGTIPHSTQYIAQAEAARMLERVGVRIQWSFGRPSRDQLRREGAISIHVTLTGSPTVAPGALAFALPFERTQITVMYDRVQAAVPPSQRPALLAHVLVHEITHILQGVNHHAESGIMKAHWNTWDFADMAIKPLPFTQYDIAMIQAGRFGAK